MDNKAVTNKKIFIRTFGCQMNERDSEIIVSLLMQEGYTPTDDIEEAGIIIFNTCAVRKHAEDRVWGKLDELKRLKTRKSRDGSDFLKNREKAQKAGPVPTFPIIGLVGCMAKAQGADAFKRAPYLDFVAGPANIYDIPELVEKARDGKRHLKAVDNEKRPIKKGETRFRVSPVRALVNISEGCNNYCSYCIVPYVRGNEVSRPADDILDEVKKFVDTGAKEIMYLGQNVNSFHDGSVDFIKLLEETDKIDGLKRIRFMTSHPKDANNRLFKAVRDIEKVCEHMHLPLQSGSDNMLKAMNRQYTASHYLKLIDDLRKTMPDCAITTDLIVGFPGETEQDFLDTYMLMKKVEFDGAYIFKYSPRPFTKAADLKDDVPKAIKEERHQALLNMQVDIVRKKNESLVGKTEESLGLSFARHAPETSSDLDADYIKGRTRKNAIIVYKGDKGLIGAVSDVKILAVEDNTLIGETV